MKDYLKDYRASFELASKIRDYWHNRNRRWVRVWVEKDELGHWVIRSNLMLKATR